LAQPRSWAWLWIVWFATLFYLSSLPGDAFDFNPPFDWFDKIEHAGFFFLGGLALGGAVVARGRWPALWWVLPAAAAVVGAFDEWHQLYSPGRSGLDVFDWLADVIGGSLAAIPVTWWARRRVG
jgi:VanZ family protein